MTDSKELREQDWEKNLQDALDELELQSVEWHKECEADIKDSGYPLGYGKELRRARKWVMNCVEALIERRVAEGRIDELKQLVADTLTPENVNGHFIHDEVTEFAKQQKEFINSRLTVLSRIRRGTEGEDGQV